VSHEPNIEALAWGSLGALLMLTIVLLALVLFGWKIIGAHVVSVLAESGKRAVDARLGKKEAKKKP
jgi:hypothetical protein